MRVIDEVRRSGVAVGPQRPIRDAAMIMDQAEVGSLAVIEDGRLVGIVTDRDLVRRALAQDLAPTTPVENVMSAPVVTIGADVDLHSAFRLFRSHGVRRVAVVDLDEFVGMITVDDLLLDLAMDLLDLARPIAAEIFTPEEWADRHERGAEDTATGVADQPTQPQPSGSVEMFASDELICIEPNATLHQVAQRLAEDSIGALVVAEGEEISGIISERDVVRAVASRKDLDATTAAEVGTRRVVRCTTETSIQTAALLMMKQYVRHLLVEDRNEPVGIVSARDLLGAYAT